MNLILKIAISSPLRRCFDYLPPKVSTVNEIEPGMRVKVPFARSTLIGVVMDLSDHSDVPETKIKRVNEVLDDEPLFSLAELQLLKWSSQYYHYGIGEVVFNALPALLRKGKPAHLEEALRYYLTSLGQQLDINTLKRAPRQAQLLSFMRAHPDGVSKLDLQQLEGQWSAILKTLQEKHLLEKRVPELQATTPKFESAPYALSEPQQQAVTQVQASLGNFGAFLLDGVTGSGKTEVYMHLAHTVVQQQKQLLLLVPEIGLTPQIVSRFEKRFAHTVYAYHSALNDTERLRTWLNAKKGEAYIVIGTRSAVTLPMPNLGLIIVDEEHDTSFKQQETHRFSARDFAVRRAQKSNIPIVLGSATPSVESLGNVALKRYQYLQLPKRVGAAQQPKIEVIDMRSQSLRHGMTQQLILQIREVLTKGEQALLFLNRRGYSPVLMCHDCGWIAVCDRCDSKLIYYERNAQLRCHHCISERKMSPQCPECQSEQLVPIGHGTERIEAALQEIFDGAEILRIDRDSTRQKGSMEKMLARVKRGDPMVLVGTQMLAKGHHFPNVTLVGILNIDSGLHSTDFHATERLAQLIVQVAGRAGRAEKPGHVILQTHYPDHPLLQLLLQRGYNKFAQAVLQEREQAQLPPFSNMTLLRAESVDRDKPMAFLRHVKQWANQINAQVNIEVSSQQSVFILGPVTAAMEKRAGRYRAQLLFQCVTRAELHKMLAPLVLRIESDKMSRKVRWSIDVDPIDMV